MDQNIMLNEGFKGVYCIILSIFCKLKNFQIRDSVDICIFISVYEYNFIIFQNI